MDFGPVLIVGFIVLVVITIVVSMINAQKRRQEFLAWCAARKFMVDESKDYGMESRFPELKCLQQGDSGSQYAFDRFNGDWKGRSVLGFNYHYETHSTDSKGNTTTNHHYFSVVTVQSSVPLKPLLVRPENLFDKFCTVFGAEDINFESAEFSRAFYVKAPDRKWAYDVIHARMMEYFLQAPRFYIEMQRDNIFAYRNSRFKLQDFDDAMYFLDGILDRLPDYLKKQQLEVQTWNQQS